MSERSYAYCAVVDGEGRVVVTEYVADDDDDFIGLHGDAVALESAPIDDGVIGDWIRREAEQWALTGDPEIEVVRGRRPE